MQNDRITALQRMLDRDPGDLRALFGLALELEKLGDWERVAFLLRSYLQHADDEGNGWGRLGNALLQLGHTDEARDAYRQGIVSARRHGHPGMAAEFEMALLELE